MSSLKAARIVIEAPVVSFRYPHFLVGRQVTYVMPPPSTILGQVAAATGGWPDPEWFRFSYVFSYAARDKDLEHQHVIYRAGGRTRMQVNGEEYPVSVEGNVQPHERDFLFGAKLVLYVDRPELAEAFLRPQYCLSLGRSQDLACVVDAREVELVEAERAYLENTLLPFSYRPRVGRGTTVLMPRHIEPPPERVAFFERFITLPELVYAGRWEEGKINPSRRVMNEETDEGWLVDPESSQENGVHRGIVWISCAGN